MNIALILILTAAPLATALATALTAKKTNAKWRERRAARLAQAVRAS